LYPDFDFLKRDYLKQNRNILEKISLKDNSIGDLGLIAIADGINSNCNLTSSQKSGLKIRRIKKYVINHVAEPIAACLYTIGFILVNIII
jgi:hypothetical protein